MNTQKTPQSLDYECEAYSITTNSDGEKIFAYVRNTYPVSEEGDCEGAYKLERPAYEMSASLSDLIEAVEEEDEDDMWAWHLMLDVVLVDDDPAWLETEDADQELMADLWTGYDETNYLHLTELTLDTPDGVYWCDAYNEE